MAVALSRRRMAHELLPNSGLFGLLVGALLHRLRTAYRGGSGSSEVLWGAASFTTTKFQCRCRPSNRVLPRAVEGCPTRPVGALVPETWRNAAAGRPDEVLCASTTCEVAHAAAT